MQVLQTKTFIKQTKKLHSNQKIDLDKAVRSIIKNPSLGEIKKGDLSNVQVYKFNMINQLTLLAYTFLEENKITLLAVGSHENFYRDLKK